MLMLSAAFRSSGAAYIRGGGGKGKKARDFYWEWCAPEEDQPPCCKGNQYGWFRSLNVVDLVPLLRAKAKAMKQSNEPAE